MKVLITGGAGYIGSHCNRYFNEQGIETVVVDDLSDGHEDVSYFFVPIMVMKRLLLLVSL